MATLLILLLALDHIRTYRANLGHSQQRPLPNIYPDNMP